jgi:predicted RNA-binding protein with RPS1 domain
VPVSSPGPLSLASLQVNQQLTGSVVSLYEGPAGQRKLFLDVGITRTDKQGKHYPVFGMVRLQGPYQNKTYAYGQRLDELYVDEIYPGPARLLLRLTPVYKRPAFDAAGQPLPVYRLQDLKVGMPLVNGTVVSVTENYCFIDAGVIRGQSAEEQFNKQKEDEEDEDGRGPRTKLRQPKPRRLNGRLYRLDLQETYALSEKYKTASTLSILTPGMSLPVYVKGVHLNSWQYSLTVDPSITAEKAAMLKEEREAQLTAMKSKQPVDALLIGESRKGVITKILPGGVKVGIGVKKTGFVSLDSICEAYGNEIKDLKRVLVVGGRLQVEVDEVSEDGERIDLRCLEIYPQEAVVKKKAVVGKGKGKGGGGKVVKDKKKEKVVKEEDEEEEEGGRGGGIKYDDDDDDEYNRLGYDDEW